MSLTTAAKKGINVCDYDGDYDGVHLRSKSILTRKAHKCASCETSWPAKTRMELNVGLCDGYFSDYRICPVCLWAEKQPDHSDLHLCMNWGPDPQDGYHRVTRASDAEVFNYLRYCHENGETPTVTHLAAVVKQIRIADGEWEEDAA